MSESSLKADIKHKYFWPFELLLWDRFSLLLLSTLFAELDYKNVITLNEDALGFFVLVCVCFFILKKGKDFLPCFH